MWTLNAVRRLRDAQANPVVLTQRPYTKPA